MRLCLVGQTSVVEGRTTHRRPLLNQSLKRLFCAILVCLCAQPGLALDTASGGNSKTDFERKYEMLTFEVLLLGFDFEQYSLNYRIEALRDQKLKRTRYFLGQETAAAGAMTAAIIGIDQTHKVLYHPEKVSTHALRNLQTIGEVTSIIGASSSGVELTANGWHALRDKIKHQDSKAAASYLTKQMRKIDSVLTEREALLASQTDLPASSPRMVQYKAETKLLNTMRDIIVQEHKNFEATKVGFRTQENVFYVLNIGTTILSALQYRYGYRSVRRPKLGGTSGVFSLVSGAMVMGNPVLAAAASTYAKRKTKKAMEREFGVVGKPPSVAELKASVLELQNASAGTKDDPSCQATSAAILDAYGVINQIFPRQLESEIALLHTLDEVAVQNVIMSQPIGGAATASGIASVRAFYRYGNQPRKAARQNLAAGIWGVTGAGMATGLTALGYGADLYYSNLLKKKGQLPEQLMQSRITASKNVTARIKKSMEEISDAQ